MSIDKIIEIQVRPLKRYQITVFVQGSDVQINGVTTYGNALTGRDASVFARAMATKLAEDNPSFSVSIDGLDGPPDIE
jgi:hypothetical protein